MFSRALTLKTAFSGIALLFLLLPTSTSCFATNSARVISIPAFDYHTYSPYNTNSQKAGLSYDWVRYLNKYLTHIKLELVHVDRPTLDTLLKANTPGLILWSNPRWFGAFPALLASEPIFMDSDILVSVPERPVKQFEPGRTYRLCAIKGYVYPTLEPFLERKILKRVDDQSTKKCLSSVQSGRADLALLNRSTWLYMNEHQKTPKWVVYPESIDAFARHLLVSSHYQALLPELNAAIEAVNNDPEWRALLLVYGSKNFLDLFELTLDSLLELPVR